MRQYPINIFILLVFLFFEGTLLFAGGQKEDRLPEAQKLIAEGKYDNAILVLSDIMKTNPDNFVKAEKLMKEIRTARNKYNALYKQLITVLNPPRGEAIDQNKAYSLMRSMEKLDKTPNKAAVAAFSQARDTIFFAVANRTFENILTEGTALLKNKKYPQAIDKYLSGFNLHREFFVKRDYGNIIFNKIDSDIAEIKSYSNQFKSLFEMIQSEFKVVHTASQNKSLPGLEKSIKKYRDLLLQAIILKRKAVYLARELDDIRKSIQKESESDIPYLSTLRVLTKGRVASKVPEGIAGTIELYSDAMISSGVNDIEPLLTASYKKGLSLYTGNSFPEGESEFRNTRRYTDVLITLLDLRGGLIDLDSEGEPTEKGWVLIKKWLPDLLYPEETDQTALQYLKLAGQNEQLSTLVKQVQNSSVPSIIKEQQGKLRKITEQVHNDAVSAEKRINRLNKLSASGIDVNLSRPLAEDISNARVLFLKKLYSSEINFSEKIARLQIDPLEKTITTVQTQIHRAENMIEGTSEKVDSLELIVKRPDTAASILNKSDKILKDTDQKLSSIETVIKGYDKNVRDAEALQLQVSRIRSLQLEIKKYHSDIKVDSGKAAELNSKADDQYNLATLRLNETYSLYDRRKYDTARSKYFEAEKAYQKSLEYREDKKVRALLSGKMSLLYDRIITALNKQIIREVRALINQGRDYYNVEKFLKAEQSLQQARDRYKVTHEEPNPEVESWLVKVKKALEATSGRVIALTDPLYPEMIHILNLAEQDFIKGKELLRQNKTDKAKSLFSDAVKNIEYVKETFPRNFKASVLYLRILEYTERGTFDNYFKSMYNSAVAKIKTDPKSADDDLLALYEVKPNYPGIRKTLYRSGIAAGRITPPPAKVDVAKARNLYVKAKKIVNADNRAQFPIAIAYLEEALQIDSNYNTAAILLDQLRTSSGRTGESTMTDADQQSLRYAENLYIEGKYLEASIIINQLWSNPKNRSSSKLNDLKKKVDAQL